MQIDELFFLTPPTKFNEKLFIFSNPDDKQTSKQTNTLTGHVIFSADVMITSSLWGVMTSLIIKLLPN